MLTLLFKSLSKLPLPLLHKLGQALGFILFYSMKKGKRCATENMTQSNLFPNKTTQAVRQNFSALGKAILETPYVWNSNNKKIAQLIRHVHGWDAAETSTKSGKGVIFLALHMGCFEIASLHYALHHPITVLYRPPKKKWLMPLIHAGRSRNNVTLAEANTSGVRKLLQTLKKGGAVGILPDQMPGAGEGEWASLFGKPAYTMTLASRLAEKTGATVIMSFGERLANGEGYTMHYTKLEDHAIATPSLLNQAIEAQIKQCANQYYWNYHRYKVSRKAKPLPASTETDAQ